MDPDVPDRLIRIHTVDAHAEGEPLRVILDGFPMPVGETVLARLRDARERLDALRTALMWEPRGHADMYGCLLMPPVSERADISVLFMHNDGFSTMCGHGVIAVSTVLVETGLQPPTGSETVIGIDTPAGLVRATARTTGDRVGEVRFENVPSFAWALDASIHVPGLGDVRYDLAFGGAFYAFVEARPLGLDLCPGAVGDLIRAGREIKRALAEAVSLDHPTDPELAFLYGTVFVGPASVAAHHSRHVCVFADGEVDRSPTGTGVSARLALLHAKGELRPGDEISIESIVGGRFTGRILRTTRAGSRDAVIPEIGGRAFLTGRHEFLIDPEDPWKEGFLVR
jgi:trans-L-3-hydroxyproline dehydratase